MYFQKTMFVANPGTHQQPVSARFSTARPVTVVHPAGGGEPGKVQSGSHSRVSELQALGGALGIQQTGPGTVAPGSPAWYQLQGLGQSIQHPSGGVSPAPPQPVHRGGVPVRKPKIHAPHPQSRLNRKPGGR